MEFINAFWVGGLICVVGQLLIDLTKLTPAKVMVLFVVSGVVLGAFGVYGWLVDFAGAGATVPLCGFGWSLAEGVKEAVAEKGFYGIFSGGITAAAGGITAALVFGVLGSAIVKSGDKS